MNVLLLVCRPKSCTHTQLLVTTSQYLRLKDEDKDKDLMSKDEDLKIGPRGQGLSSRTTSQQHCYESLYESYIGDDYAQFEPVFEAGQ